MTKETLWAEVNAATDAARLDALEAIAEGVGYGPDGLLRQTIAQRRERLTGEIAETPRRKGAKER